MDVGRDGRIIDVKMIGNFLLVGVGGFLGSILRYGVSLLMASAGGGMRFPIGTLAVNFLGSLIIGVLVKNIGAESSHHMLAVVGFCGGFTTFSTFSLEVVKMFEAGAYVAAAAYVTLSLILCLAAVWIGFAIKI